jgi:hypothetical protein
VTDKIEEKDILQHGFAFLAKAAAKEHALTPLQVMRTYWRALFWCIFICIGTVLLGYDGQVRRHSNRSEREPEVGVDNDVEQTVLPG